MAYQLFKLYIDSCTVEIFFEHFELTSHGNIQNAALTAFLLEEALMNFVEKPFRY